MYTSGIQSSKDPFFIIQDTWVYVSVGTTRYTGFKTDSFIPVISIVFVNDVLGSLHRPLRTLMSATSSPKTLSSVSFVEVLRSYLREY